MEEGHENLFAEEEGNASLAAMEESNRLAWELWDPAIPVPDWIIDPDHWGMNVNEPGETAYEEALQEIDQAYPAVHDTTPQIPSTGEDTTGFAPPTGSLPDTMPFIGSPFHDGSLGPFLSQPTSSFYNPSLLPESEVSTDSYFPCNTGTAFPTAAAAAPPNAYGQATEPTTEDQIRAGKTEFYEGKKKTELAKMAKARGLKTGLKKGELVLELVEDDLAGGEGKGKKKEKKAKK